MQKVCKDIMQKQKEKVYLTVDTKFNRWLYQKISEKIPLRKKEREKKKSAKPDSFL